MGIGMRAWTAAAAAPAHVAVQEAARGAGTASLAGVRPRRRRAGSGAELVAEPADKPGSV